MHYFKKTGKNRDNENKAIKEAIESVINAHQERHNDGSESPCKCDYKYPDSIDIDKIIKDNDRKSLTNRAIFQSIPLLGGLGLGLGLAALSFNKKPKRHYRYK
jgi:hypothetical protein